MKNNLNSGKGSAGFTLQFSYIIQYCSSAVKDQSTPLANIRQGFMDSSGVLTSDLTTHHVHAPRNDCDWPVQYCRFFLSMSSCFFAVVS